MLELTGTINPALKYCWKKAVYSANWKSESHHESDLWTIRSVHMNGTIRVQCRMKSLWLNIRRVTPCFDYSKYLIKTHPLSPYKDFRFATFTPHFFSYLRLPFFLRRIYFWHLIAPFVGASDMSQGCLQGIWPQMYPSVGHKMYS